MDYANMRSLLEEPEIQELLLMLGILERRNDSKNLEELCGRLDHMTDTVEAVMIEVSKMKEQLLLMNEKKSLKDSLSKMVKNLGEQAQDMTARLYEIRQEVRDKSKEVIQEVLNNGIAGLRKMTDFLGIKDKLVSLRGIAENSLVKTEAAIKRMEQAGSQARQAMVDVKNIGRSLAGKEMAEVNPEKRSKVGLAVMAPMKLHHTFTSIVMEEIDKSIGNIDAFLKEGVVREPQLEEIDFTQEPRGELVVSRQDDRPAINPVQDIDTLLNAWEKQRKCIGAEVRPLLPDKARAL